MRRRASRCGAHAAGGVIAAALLFMVPHVGWNNDAGRDVIAHRRLVNVVTKKGAFLLLLLHDQAVFAFAGKLALFIDKYDSGCAFYESGIVVELEDDVRSTLFTEDVVHKARGVVLFGQRLAWVKDEVDDFTVDDRDVVATVPFRA